MNNKNKCIDFKTKKMSICFKCNKSIKPASLATEVGGEKYHPTCIECAICHRALWGRQFKTQNKKLICQEPCVPPQQPQQQPPPLPLVTDPFRPSSAAQRQQQLIIMEQQRQQQLQYQQPPPVLMQYPTSYQMNPPYMNNAPLLIPPQNKLCRLCNQPLFGKRFITFENGDTVCQNCDMRQHAAPYQAVPSAHIIVCSCCTNTIQGGKYYTEPNGAITCENCELTGARCTKCKILFKFNETRRVMSNGTPYHEACFSCSQCHTPIQTRDFYQTEQMQPMCLNCYQTSRLPKCTQCAQPLADKYLMIDNKPMHYHCFKCTNCQQVIDNEVGYFKNKMNQLPICSNCNLKLNGVRCFRCSNVIEKNGLTFSNNDYHEECFRCDKCNVELTKMKKTLTDRECKGLYCEPCFNQNFAPRCFKCSNPILPNLPGVQYENNTYHKECHACSRCKKTVANKKFFKQGNILICEYCN